MTEVDEDDHVYYQFKGIETLKLNTSTAFTLSHLSSTNNQFYICGYIVNNKNSIPFNQFLLCKNTKNTLVLPSFTVPRKSHANILDLAKQYIFQILNTTMYTYKGYNKYNDRVYLYFDLTKSTLNVNASDDVFYALVDELLNAKQIFGYLICDEVTQFFNHFIELLFLKDSSNKSYSIPVVAYAGINDASLSHYIFAFGISKTNSDLGEYYYFTSYSNLENKKETKTIMRFALLVERIMVIIDDTLPTDKIGLRNSDCIHHVSREQWAINNYNQQVALSHYILSEL